MLIPFICVAASYFIYDPFFVLYDHGDNYFVENGTPDAYTLNRDFVATEYILRYGKKENFNSFILGSSRASAFITEDWQKYLDDSSKVFHFNCDNETLFGLYNKLLFLQNQNLVLTNVLLVIDHQLLNRSIENRAPRERYHYAQTGNPAKFHYAYFKDYLGSNFFIQYLVFKLVKKKFIWMDKLFENEQEFRRMNYSKYNMQWTFEGDNLALKENIDSFYSKRIHLFKAIDNRPKRHLGPILEKENKIILLYRIKDILSSSNSKFKIIVSPLHNKLRLNENDLRVLQSIYGIENVFDFSGENKITSNYQNYYEPSHYRPHIGKLIMDSIYTTNF